MIKKYYFKTYFKSVFIVLYQVYVEKFKQKMKFKHHHGTHYGRLIRRFGPLSHIKVIRLEGKHKTMKSYTKNTNNRINMSYSLARKVQYNTALRLLKAEGFQDQITTHKIKTISLKDQWAAVVVNTCFKKYLHSNS